MSAIPTVATRICCQDAQGRVVAGALVSATLTTQDRYLGQEVPASTRGQTDSYGVVELQLFPNELGSEGSVYSISATMPQGGTVVRTVAIPNAACDLVLGPRASVAASVQAILDEVLVARDATAQLQASVSCFASEAAALVRQADALTAVSVNTSQQQAAISIQAAERSVEAADRAAGYATLSGILPAMRDTLGKFPGVIQPSLNLFCPDMTSDAVPLGTFTRSTGGYRMGPTGPYEWVAGGLVRREWDTDGKLLGWMLDGGVTNSIVSNSDFSNPVWVRPLPTPVSVTTGETDLFGGVTGQSISKSSTGDALLRQIITISADTLPIAVSAFVMKKAGGKYKIRITDTGTFNIECYIFYDADKECIDSKHGPIVTSGVIPGPNGSQRVFFSMLNASVASWAVDIVPMSVSLPDIVMGVQVERRVSPSSLVPTTDAPAIRSADIWTIPTSAYLFNASAGTMYASVVPSTISPGLRHIMTLGKNVYSDVILLRFFDDMIEAIVYKDGCITARLVKTNVIIGTQYRIAFAWEQNSFALSVNGGIDEVLSGEIPTGITNLDVGHLLNGYHLNGPLYDARLFPRRIQNNILQLMTA